ncbi:C6 transcription factor [Penicillium chermesinum]|nr:C6 transcription factor [Penicillium chermesinum]
MDEPRRYNVERSCLRCHERKVRCDKRSPCSKCVRLNLPCHYPGLRIEKRRPPRSADADVVARLEQLERAITSLAAGPSLGNIPKNAEAPVRETALDSESSLPSSSAQHGFLGKDGTYMDEPLLARVLEKEKELQSAIGSPRTGSGILGKWPRLKADGILVNPLITQVDIRGLLPGRWQATILWETFLHRVDPVLKILHIPSVKPRVFAAINRPDTVSSDIHCLLFAICYSASTVLCSDNPENEAAREDLSKYQQGLQLGIFHSSFLDAPTLTSLQAMAIYLSGGGKICLRCNSSGRAGFNLRGLAMRAAQSIGIHRDGKHFKLSPLECELRRRLWWLLYATDVRAAEDHGITITEQELGGDCDVPANIDDQDINEEKTERVPSQPRWTEMTFPLIIIHMNRVWAHLIRAKFDGGNAEKLVKELNTLLNESFLQYCDPDIPIQRLGLLLSRVLKCKLEVHIRQKTLQSQGPSSMNTEAGQELLATAVSGLNYGLQMWSDELLRSYRWLISTHTQYHLLTYILWHLCMSPTGTHVEDAWRTVNIHFDVAEKDPSWPDPGPGVAYDGADACESAADPRGAFPRRKRAATLGA